MTERFSFKRISQEKFFKMREAWNSLLKSSRNDNLFLTWEWQTTWWRTWGVEHGLKLKIIGVYDHQNELIGIAPLFERNTKVLRVIPCKEWRLIGSSSGFANTVRSEYLGFICYEDLEDIIIKELLAYIWKNERWDKLILNDILTTSPLFGAVSSSSAFEGRSYQRTTLKDYGVKLDKSVFTEDLDSYKVSLSSSMRREAFLRRKRLEAIGKVENSLIHDTGTAIELLNCFHQKRWSKPCFDNKATTFHHSILDQNSPNISSHIEETKLNNETISITYNLDYKDTRYNIQLGFQKVNDKKISVGYLQLGTSLEKFFSSEHCRYFDFLAGSGKEIFYKDKFGGTGYRLFSIEVVRTPLFKAIYCLNDLHKSKRRKKL